MPRPHTKRDLRAAIDLLTQPDPTHRSQHLWNRARGWREDAGWARHRGIQGFGIGPKVVDDRVTSRRALRVYVARKQAPETLSSAELVPRALEVPGVREPVPTDVVDIGEMKLESNRGRVRPARPGYGVGCGTRSGTLGLVVRRIDDPTGRYVLSNAHVLASDGFGRVGADVVVQPCADDDADVGNNLIAVLADFVPLTFTEEGNPNFVDAAIAKADDPAMLDPFIRKIGYPRGLSGRITEQMVVQKTGYRTDYTSALVQDAEYVGAFWYEAPDGRVLRAGFHDLVLCDNYSLEGDSGAAVLDVDSRVVGIHLGGSDKSSVFCRARDVFGLLRIALVT